MFGIETLLFIGECVIFLLGDDIIMVHHVLVVPVDPVESQALLVSFYRQIIFCSRFIKSIDVGLILIGIRVESHHDAVIGCNRSMGMDKLSRLTLGTIHPDSIFLGSKTEGCKEQGSMAYWFFLLFFLCLFLLLLLLLLLLSILLFLLIVILLVLLFLGNRLGFMLCLFHRHAFSYKLLCHASNIGLNIAVLTRNFYLVVFVKRLGFFLFFHSLIFFILLEAFIDGFQIGIKCLIDIIVESMFFHQTYVGNMTHFYLIFFLIILEVEDIIVRHGESWYLSLDFGELLGNTLIGYFFHILRGILFQAIAVYIVKNLFFCHLTHEVIGSTYTAVIHYGVVVILIEDIITAILFGIGEGKTLLHRIALVIHLGLLKNLLVIALLL